MSQRFIVIMAGGSGERFWPQSRRKRPKHLLPIVGRTPMLTQTIARVRALVPGRNIFVITTKAQRSAVRQVCGGIPAGNIVAEPMGRDTAAAVGLAALLVKQRDPAAAFAMLPADHVIRNAAAFRRSLRLAFRAAEAADELVTLGIPPTAPSTGFGYIERGGEWTIAGVKRAKRFVEKPPLARAQAYVASGRYYWNAGMFVWRVPVIEAAFRAHAPKLAGQLNNLGAAMRRQGVAPALAKHYPALQKISIDFAVMEDARNVLVVPADIGWDDVGSWTALGGHFPADEAGNLLLGKARVESGRNNIVISTTGHLAAVLGVDGLVVVHTPDATLVCPAERAQDIKRLLLRLREDPATAIHL